MPNGFAVYLGADSHGAADDGHGRRASDGAPVDQSWAHTDAERSAHRGGVRREGSKAVTTQGNTWERRGSHSPPHTIVPGGTGRRYCINKVAWVHLGGKWGTDHLLRWWG